MSPHLWFRVCVCFAGLLVLPLALSLGMREVACPLSGFAEDDSWFYAQIAYQWPRMGLPSFDGIHPTSGFHLLWGAVLGIVSGLLSLVTDDKHSHAVAFFSVYSVLLAMVAEQSSRGARRRRLSFLCILVLFTTSAFLMETAMLTLFLLLLGRRLLGFEGACAWSRQGLAVAVLGIWIVLCRLDAVIIAVVWAVIGWRQPWSRALVLGALVGVALQLTSMQVLFGEWFSVSSQLKAARAAQGEGGLLACGMKGGILFRAGVGALLTLWAWLAVRSERGRARVVKLGGLLGVAVFSVAHLLLSEVRSWYFLPLYGVSWWIVACSDSCDKASRWSFRSGLMPGFAALAIAIVGYKAYRIVATEAKTDQAWAFIDKVRELVPASQPIFEIDASGFPGYWSERRLINGDGLVNTYDYARKLSAGNLAGYLEEEHICWVIVTGRMAPKKTSLLLMYHGLSVEKSQALPIYPRAPKGARGTQLWKLGAPRCELQAG
jgi:hypothetical protein